MSDRSLWYISSVFALACVAVVGGVWYVVDSSYDTNPDQLLDRAAAERLVRQAWSEVEGDAAIPPLVPTGIFIQSINFQSAVDVNLSGYVWQKYALGDDGPSRGFIFPEAIDTGSNIEPYIAYRDTLGDHELVGWYFEATLRQRFDYSDYPLDHKTVWVRMWHKDFDRTALLVPDLSAYRSTLPGDAFGLDRDIVLGSWDINETFFEYKTVGYDTGFGYGGEISERSIPELYFNIVIKRKFFNAFIINLVPLLTVAALLFATLMTVSGDEKKIALLGFDTSGVIGVCSALFFVVMLAHIQLRQEFAASGVVYIEYFYFLIYMLIIAITLNTYLFATERPIRFIQYRDNLIPKLLFWPLLLGLSALVSLWLFIIKELFE